MPDGYVECPVRGKVKRFNVIFEGDDQTFTIEPGKNVDPYGRNKTLEELKSRVTAV